MLLDLTCLPEGWEARFWARVGVSIDPEACWLWLNAPMNGRPVVALPASIAPRGQQFYAYRVASALVYGPLPGGVVVRHTCDQPMCCNPWHLLRGTQRDNIQDAVERGRFRSRRRRFTDEQVRAMRSAHRDGRSIKTLCGEYDADPNTIARIVHREHYRDVRD